MLIWKYSDAKLRAAMPKLRADANKYTRGKLTIVAGSKRYPGAAALAAMASQRMGAGYTEVVCAPQAVDTVRAASPSLVVRSWKKLGSGDFPCTREGHPEACVVGPGFDPRDDACVEVTLHALKKTQAPLLVDGGALSVLASERGRKLLRRRFECGLQTVVTPHAGEAARLAHPLGLPASDPAELSRLLSLAYGVTALVKGPKSYISDGERIAVVPDGSAALAKAGTGDVLAGMVGSLLAQGAEPFDACVLGATLHAWAGCAAAVDLTETCVVAEDIPRYLPAAIRRLEAKEAGPLDVL